MSAATDWQYSTFCQVIYLQYNIRAYSVKIKKKAKILVFWFILVSILVN